MSNSKRRVRRRVESGILFFQNLYWNSARISRTGVAGWHCMAAILDPLTRQFPKQPALRSTLTQFCLFCFTKLHNYVGELTNESDFVLSSVQFYEVIRI
ncbi:hypothetical protein BaRGS_00022749 [Batillaria attramentaria]|uniref:Uncharacterized protein n=1 Tax=Batillaria attramentaria TaxID=370345 RepID=A0ABD0KFW5_9CAEN